MVKDKFVSIAEASQLTGVGQQCLRRLFDKSVLDGYRMPFGQRRFSVDSLQQFCGLRPSTKINYLYAQDRWRWTQFITDSSASTTFSLGLQRESIELARKS